MIVTPEQVEAAHRRVQGEHGKSGRARDIAFLKALGVDVRPRACTCGYGGEHLDNNPRCEANA